MNIFTQALSESKSKDYNKNTIEDFETEFKKEFYGNMVSSRKEKIGWQKEIITKFGNKLSFISSIMMDNLSVKEAIHNLFNSKKVLAYFREYAASKLTSKKTKIKYIEKQLEDYPELDYERYQLGNLKSDIPKLKIDIKGLLSLYLDENYWTGTKGLKTVNFYKYKDYESKESLRTLYEKRSKYFHRTDNLNPSEIIKISNQYDIEIAKELKIIRTDYENYISQIESIKDKIDILFKKMVNDRSLSRDQQSRIRNVFKLYLDDFLHIHKILRNYNLVSMQFYIDYYKETSQVIHTIFMETGAFRAKLDKKDE